MIINDRYSVFSGKKRALEDDANATATDVPMGECWPIEKANEIIKLYVIILFSILSHRGLHF